MQGEWWIIGGQAIFADGDVGDYNHEAYVIEHLTAQIAEALIGEGLVEGLADGCEVEKLLKEAGENLAQAREENGEDISSLNEKDLAVAFLLAECGISQEAIDAARGLTDARDYGMKYLGWKRVNDDNIETWYLTGSDLADIIRGIGEILSDEEDDDLTIDIEVGATNKLFEDIPIAVLEAGDVGALKAYEYQSF
jgi:hypothetical protein